MRLPFSAARPTASTAASPPSAAAAALAAFLMFSPIQENTPLLSAFPAAVPAAHARELASGSGSKVNKDPESLLRLGLPNQPKEIRELQAKIEETEDNLNRILLTNAGSSMGGVKSAIKKSAAMVKAAPAAEAAKAEELVGKISASVDALGEAVATANVPAGQQAAQSALKSVSALEELIATGYKQPVPPGEFTKELPWLKGRATVAWELKRPGGKFDVEGKLYDKLDLVTIVDGYTAPLTAGNFVDLVNKGFYNNFQIQRSDGFVVQTGDPSADGSPSKTVKNGYVPEGKESVRKVPLEVYVKGDKAPLYSSTFDDDGRGGYAAALPFNAYGALGMAREEYDPDSASTQWFWLLFDSDLTPAGKNLLDGRYACFGYTVDGARYLSDVKEGDVIVSAKVTSGLDNLVNPS